MEGLDGFMSIIADDLPLLIKFTIRLSFSGSNQKLCFFFLPHM
jgi:hypothetical protein